MADPEKTTAKPLTGDGESNVIPEFTKDESEKQLHNDSASNLSPDDSVGPDDDITWHYLSFETELPRPVFHIQPHSPSQTPHQPPECPDLKKYTSPFLWPKRRKHFMTWFGCVSTSITAYTAGSYAAGGGQMMKEWSISEPVFGVGITMFTCGFGLAPMFLAPFSEINGRKPVFVVTGVLLCVFQLVCALTPTFAGMLTARFLIGCAASTFSTMIGGVLSDFYHAEDRNWAMAVFAGGAIGGTGLGPLVSGFIAQHTSWRWIFRVQVITTGMLMLVILLFFKESRGSVLLSRKAKVLNRWMEELETFGYYGFLMPVNGSTFVESKDTDMARAPQRIRWRVKSDEERATLLKMISISLYRPFHLLFTEPVVLFFSIWITFAWSVLYLLFSAIPLIFQTRYDFNVAQSCAIFAAVLIGAIISVIISVYQEPLAHKYVSNERLRAYFATPEGRLSFCCVQSSLLPIGCFWFGWTCFSDIPWIVPTLGIGCATMGIFSIYLAVFNYLADIYHIYASSALAAQSWLRNMSAGAFPVFTAIMFKKMTYQGAASFLGGVAAVLTIVPWALVLYGPRIRARSKIASALLKDRNID
jgi:multidrug resistance protein